MIFGSSTNPMPRNIYYNQAGIWRTVTAPFSNQAGTWRRASRVYYNDAGTWRQAFGLTGGTLFAASRASEAFIGAATTAFFTSAITDINGFEWQAAPGQILHTFDNSPVRNDTSVRVAGNVTEGYWTTITWLSRGSLSRVNRTTFNAWNGSYTEWIFTGDPLALLTFAGQAAASLTIVA